MRLIACHIDGFGKYVNTRFDFADGLTPYVMDNGEGKTTLAMFLRVMLYGMGTDRRGSFGARSAYNPFAGSKYGGSLEIEWQEKRYKIVREFHATSEAKDVLAVYNDRGSVCEELGKIPGETVLGFTEEAFLRTAYVTWKQLDIDLQNGIGTRLGGMPADGETIPLADALEALSDYGKTYHSGRKKSGAYTGFIPETEEKIEDKQREIYRLQRMQSELPAQKSEWKAFLAESNALAKECEAAQQAETVRARYESYRNLCAAAEEDRAKLAEIAARYPQGFPTKEETQTLREGMDKVKAVRTRLQYRQFPKQKELLEKEAQFAESGIPSAELLSQKEELIDKYNALLAETAAEQALVEQMQAEQMQAQALQNAQNAQAEARAKSKAMGARVMFLVTAVALAIAGVALLPTMLGVGLGCFGGAALMAILAFTAVKVPASGLPATAQTQLQMPTLNLSGVMAKMQAQTQLKTGLEDFFWRYGVRVSDFVAAMRILRADVQALYTLKKEAEDYEAETEALAVEEKKWTQAVDGLLEKYALTHETWEDGYNASKRYAELAHSAQTKLSQAEEYKAKFSLTEEPKTAANVEELKEKYRQADNKTRLAYEQVKAVERELEELPKLVAEVEDERLKLARYKERKALIDTTMATLQAADGALKDRYLLPMQTAFMKYAGLMGLEWAGSVSLGDELEIRFEANGQLRRAEHLSDGQRALATLCLRLAVIENVYHGELPFCIFDDPFVHLDEKHLAEVSKGMRALSASMQMVYFTCHSSRNIIDEK